MFGSCCGCNRKSPRKHNKSLLQKCVQDVATQSDFNLDCTSDAKTQTVQTKDNEKEKVQLCNSIATSPIATDKTHQATSPVVVTQPDPIPNCDISVSNAEVQRQSSVISDVKIEISDNDDDEVFCEGVGPPVKLNENLGAPGNVTHGRMPLPTWFSEEQSEETGGIQEPPATPIGRDELALRRHRFFSELLSAAQNATEHKVHFDPLGPIVAGVTDNECCNHTNDIQALVSRLENVTIRLEQVCEPVREFCKQTQELLSPFETSEPLEIEDLLPPEINMSVQGFQDILQGPFAQYLSISKQIGGDVAEHSKIVEKAFQAQLQYLSLASQSKQPSSQSEQIALLQPTSQQICAIQEFREKHRTSPLFNHLSAISESIPALGWVTISPAPAPYIKEMNDAGQFYTNRVLKDWKEKDKKHVDWVKSWVQTLTELQAFVKQFHTTGLVWSGKNAPAGGAVPPPPPSCPLPPPPMCDLSAAANDASNDRSALFAQINQGENITRSLKKVTADMQTHKNPTLRTGPAPFKAPSSAQGNESKPVSSVEKPPSFVRDGKKWLIEYQKGNNNLIVENAEMNNVVYLFRCTDSTLQVKGKINSITLDSCKKTSVVFDTLVSCVEFINCQSVQMQVLGKVPTISIDKTDGCQVYLSPDALDVEIVSSKSSEMNVLVPKGNGDYVEYPVPEQYKTTVIPNKGLSTVIVENKG